MESLTWPPWKDSPKNNETAGNGTAGNETDTYDSQLEHFDDKISEFRQKMFSAFRTVMHMRIHYNADEAVHNYQSELITWYSALQVVVMIAVTVIQATAIRGMFRGIDNLKDGKI